ncbi:unnamed protein product [Paramecium octaurelia]|uniref:Uncharacterized protein n=1 Tax=Paramecium octaurelia TaxID=43137 RepID=A0A8S1XUU5_PAROT|nr:unnamed protein product [Paramecium octaurelia]
MVVSNNLMIDGEFNNKYQFSAPFNLDYLKFILLEIMNLMIIPFNQRTSREDNILRGFEAKCVDTVASFRNDKYQQ